MLVGLGLGTHKVQGDLAPVGSKAMLPQVDALPLAEREASSGDRYR